MATSEDFTAKLMNDMDPALLDFVRTKVTSFIKWDLLRFLYDNPNTMDSAESIARSTGRNVDAVRPELDELVESGVIEKRVLDQRMPAPRADTEHPTAYSLTRDEAVRQLVKQFVEACQDRHFRVKAVYHIIKNMR